MANILTAARTSSTQSGGYSDGQDCLDVRPEEEYRDGHIPGALSVSVNALEAALQTLPREREIVANCGGPYCVFSDETVALLRSRGYRAHRLRQGLPDWRAAGMPVEG